VITMKTQTFLIALAILASACAPSAGAARPSPSPTFVEGLTPVIPSTAVAPANTDTTLGFNVSGWT